LFRTVAEPVQLLTLKAILYTTLFCWFSRNLNLVCTSVVVGPGFTDRVRAWAGFWPKFDKWYGMKFGWLEKSRLSSISYYIWMSFGVTSKEKNIMIWPRLTPVIWGHVFLGVKFYKNGHIFCSICDRTKSFVLNPTKSSTSNLMKPFN